MSQSEVDYMAGTMRASGMPKDDALKRLGGTMVAYRAVVEAYSRTPRFIAHAGRLELNVKDGRESKEMARRMTALAIEALKKGAIVWLKADVMMIAASKVNNMAKDAVAAGVADAEDRIRVMPN